MYTDGGREKTNETGGFLRYVPETDYVVLENPRERERFTHIGSSLEDFIREEFTWWERWIMDFKTWRKVRKIKKERKNGKGN